MADRSDTESPIGPAEPLHGYVNLPTDEDDENEQKPPLLAKKERSR